MYLKESFFRDLWIYLDKEHRSLLRGEGVGILSFKHFLSSLSGLIRELTAVSEVLLSTVACAAMRVTAALSRPSGRNSEEEEEQINVSIRGAAAGVGMWAQWRAVVAALACFDGEAVKKEGCTDQISVWFLSMPYLHN